MQSNGWKDVHAHPLELEDLERTLERAETCGVTRIFGVSTHPEEWEPLANLCRGEKRLYPFFGVHPWKSDGLPENWPAQLKEMLLALPESGVGEIGLDSKRTDVPLEVQRPVFVTQIRMARNLKRPCNVHLVGAWEPFLEILQEEDTGPMILHAYSGGVEMMKRLLSYPVWFSFGGAVIRQSTSEKLRASVRAVPADRLLLETDSPYQHPDGKGHMQEPAGLIRIAEAAARMRSVGVDELRRQTERNVKDYVSG